MFQHKNNLTTLPPLSYNSSRQKINIQVYTQKGVPKSKELLIYLFQHAVGCKRLQAVDCESLHADHRWPYVDEDANMQKYQRIYFRAYLYKAIFIFFACIFLALGFFALSQNLILTTHLFGCLNWLPKMVIGIVSLGLALAAMIIGKSICIAKESAMHIAEKAKHHIHKLYSLASCACSNRDSLLEWQSVDKHHRYIYLGSLNAIKEKQEETTLLLKKIQCAKDLSIQEKNMLFCQALQQMEKELREITEWAYYRLPS